MVKPESSDLTDQRRSIRSFADQDQLGFGNLHRTIGQASISVFNPFSGARRPMNIARGAACHPGRLRHDDSGTGTPLEIETIRGLSGVLRDVFVIQEGRIVPDCQASCNSCSIEFEMDTKAFARRQARPMDRPKFPQDCHARSPVAPAPSGRRTTGKPKRSPAMTAT